jgi:hypothetical protein
LYSHSPSTSKRPTSRVPSCPPRARASASRRA